MKKKRIGETNMQINKHGSFYIRNGWPTKVIDAVKNNNYIFSPNNELAAIDGIGVGRIMIKAMRYWSVVLGLTYETKTSQGVFHSLTELGEIIFKYDPYCQNIGSLWLMHRSLSCNKDSATAWYWAFNEMNAKSFTKESFSSDFDMYIKKQGDQYAKSAIEKEFDCFKNTYVSDKAFDLEKIIEEDTIPFFAPLRLVQYLGEGRFELRRSRAKEVPIPVLFYCIIEDNSEHLKGSLQIGLDVLLEGMSQIGRYMNLSYATLLELLQQMENIGLISLVNNFGNRYIQINNTNSSEVLDKYFSEIRG